MQNQKLTFYIPRTEEEENEGIITVTKITVRDTNIWALLPPVVLTRKRMLIGDKIWISLCQTKVTEIPFLQHGHLFPLSSSLFNILLSILRQKGRLLKQRVFHKHFQLDHIQSYKSSIKYIRSCHKLCWQNSSMLTCFLGVEEKSQSKFKK